GCKPGNRWHDDAAICITSDDIESPLDLDILSHRRHVRLNTHNRCSSFKRSDINRSCGFVRIEQERDAFQARGDLSQELQPFGGHRWLDACQSCNIPAWMGEALSKPERDRITKIRDYDGDGMCPVAKRGHNSRAGRHDHVRWEIDYLFKISLYSI